MSQLFYSWMPGEHVQFNAYFASGEFESPDHIGVQVIAQELISRLLELRMRLGKPVVVTSGFRTAAYQEDLRRRGFETAVGVSSHERGIAVDISTEGHNKAQLEAECLDLFPCVGIGRSFVHVDLRDDRRRVWRYQAL